MIKHRFRVYKQENTKAGTIYPLMDENNSVWVKGNLLGVATAVMDLPHVMAKTEDEAWSWLPTEIEIAPPETKLIRVEFVYKQGNRDWQRIFVISPDDVPAVVQKVQTQKEGWVEFDTFSGKKILINLSEVTRIVVHEEN